MCELWQMTTICYDLYWHLVNISNVNTRRGQDKRVEVNPLCGRCINRNINNLYIFKHVTWNKVWSRTCRCSREKRQLAFCTRFWWFKGAAILGKLRLTYAMCSRHVSKNLDCKMQHLANLENISAALLQSDS